MIPDDLFLQFLVGGCLAVVTGLLCEAGAWCYRNFNMRKVMIWVAIIAAFLTFTVLPIVAMLSK